MSAKLTLQEVDSELKSHGLKRIGEYRSPSLPVKCENEEGYVVYPRICNLRKKTVTRKFSVSNPDSIKNISLWINLNNKPFDLIGGQNFIKAKDKLTLKCRKCDEVFVATWDHIHSGAGCPFCSGNKVGSKNSCFTKRPDLLRYFEDPEQAKEILPNSRRSIKFLCPYCGSKKESPMYWVSYWGFSCKNCSDGVSTPEKFVSNLLKCLRINFIPQYSPEWSEGKRYDFFLNDFNLIIETHGRQHYVDNLSGYFAGNRNEKENDVIKERLAKINGYNYVTIDCRESSLDWLKENLVKELGNHLNFSNIDWKDIFVKSQNSFCRDSWNLWNAGLKSPLAISKKLGINRFTIINYLKRGSELGIVEYDPKEEMRKSARRTKINTRKSVNQYSLSGNFIKKWDGVIEVEKNLGIGNSGIYQCASGKLKSAAGFIWKFTDDNSPIEVIIRRPKKSNPINQYSRSGDFINKWESAQEASSKLGIRCDRILDCLENKAKSTKGFIWRFCDDYL